MDLITAYRNACEFLTKVGDRPQTIPNNELVEAWKTAEQHIGMKDPKRTEDECPHSLHGAAGASGHILLPFLLATRLAQSVSKERYLFGYTITCATHGRFHVSGGSIYLVPS